MIPTRRSSDLQLLQFAQRLRHALLALTRGAPARRDDPRAGLRQLARHFLRQRGDLRARFLQAALQRAATVERGLAGVGAHPRAVLRHPIELDQPLVHQHRQYLAHQLVQCRALGAAKLTQHMVVDRHPAADPAVGGMQHAQPRQFTCALLTPWLSPYSHSPSRIFGSVASRPALPSCALIDSSNRPSSSPSSTRQIARAGCSASSSPSRSVGCRISCLRLASRSRTASSITAPPPLHLPPYHPYSTTLLRSLRLKKSQTRRMTE